MKEIVMSGIAQLEANYPAVLNTRQVCEILQVTRHTLYKLVAVGTLSPMPLRGIKSHRFSRDAVTAIIRNT